MPDAVDTDLCDVGVLYMPGLFGADRLAAAESLFEVVE